MQENFSLENEPASTDAAQHGSVGATAMVCLPGGGANLDPFTTIRGLAARMERLASEVTVVEQRAAGERKNFEALAAEMRSLARRTLNAVAEVVAAASASSRLVCAWDSTAAEPMLELTDSERELFEQKMGTVAHGIAAVIGMPATMLLVAKCGGNQISPFGKDFAFVSDLLGVEAASKLKKWLGPSPLQVPLCERAQRAVLHSRIRAEFDRLTTVDKVSSREAIRNLTNFTQPRLNERTIYRILKQTD